MECTNTFLAILAAIFLSALTWPSAAGPLRASEPTPLELDYARRAGEPLSLFGYETFSVPPGGGDPPLGAVQDDHRLGIGDELSVTLRGEHVSSGRHRVGTDGLVTIAPLRPVAAAGRTLGEFKAELEAETAARLPHAEVFVTLTALRRISVLVMGAVARPGRVEVSGQSSILDGLLAAGGVTRHGSLRRIRLAAGDGIRDVDLYDLLAEGGGNAMDRLRDGDRIVVPPLGPTVAVAGNVRRPGIFELPEPAAGTTAADALALAGGPLHPGRRDLLSLTFGPDGQEMALDVGDAETAVVRDGDVLIASTVRSGRRGAVRVDGRVAVPGLQPLETVSSLQALVETAGLRPDSYLPFAVLERTDPASGTRTLVAVDLAAAPAGARDLPLADEDTLVVLGTEEVAFLTSDPVLDLIAGRRIGTPTGCAGLTVLARRLASGAPSALPTNPLGRLAGELAPSGQPCPVLLDRYPDVLSFALDHAVLMRAGVARPGFYPVAGAAAVDDLARAAGVSGSDSKLAVTTAAGRAASDSDFARPGDVVEPAQPGYELAGHVRYPGWRRLSPGTTLRQVLGDGTGLEDGVYPLSAAIDRFDRATLARRVIAFAPADVVKGRLDLRLEPGDRIVLFAADDIPEVEGERPTGSLGEEPEIAAALAERTVEIRGAVRRPGRYPIAGPVALGALIRQAGGFAADADPSHTEVTSTSHGSGAHERRTYDLGLPGAGTAEIDGPAVIRIRHRDEHPVRTVSIDGEVRHPGSYEIVAGETLASLLGRAGGLTDEAYPAGTVFLREANRRQEADGFARTASEIDRNLALALAGQSPPSVGEVEAMRRLAADLRSVRPLGRITVEADPTILASKPELDILLDAGDQVIVPQRPLTVTVSGEVLAPGHLGFTSAKTAIDYIRQAGGTTREADDGRTFMILPDGSAQPLAVSFWNHEPVFVPPGATIVVPRDPKPFDLLDVSSSIGSVLGELARTAATITILSR
ncbi:SLBB domain-containing protein [Arenibaculum sp.]|uniref:SLBB domain-containing protein n=1 Tax=Arenibaculum sp. TaxID=2865862 RepID=UPI002E11F6A5|nr:SLBB domain-containing protein [Arenibaculum sp.]